MKRMQSAIPVARRLITCAALIVIMLTCWIAPVAAQTTSAPFDLSISPSVVEIAIQPGKIVTQTFLLENTGAVDLEVTPTLRDFRANNQDGIPDILETNTFPYIGLENSDITFDQPFTLKAGSSQQFVVAIKPAADAETRDWYSAFIFNTKPLAGTQLGGMAGAKTTGAVVANILVKITNDNATPLEWKLELPRVPTLIDSLQSLTITPVVTNLSSTVATPDVSVLVLNWRKEVVAEFTALPERVLANSTRTLQGSQPLKEDPRSFVGTPMVFDPLFAIGPYTIRATIRNSATGPVVFERTFTALPLAPIIVLTGVGLTLWGVRRWQMLQRNKEALPIEE